MSVISRIAPTPSGYLHVGNIVNFVLTAALTRQKNGRLYLRIDDLEPSRVRDEYIEDILKTLDWLNIEYDSGPTTVEEFKKSYSQLLKQEEFESFLFSKNSDSKDRELNGGASRSGEGELQSHLQSHFYACDCTRKSIESFLSKNTRNGDGGELTAEGLNRNVANYPGICRSKKQKMIFGEYALRMKVPEGKRGKIADPVVWRKDGLAGYHLVSLCEDLRLGVNFVVRGEDLFESSVVQRVLATVLRIESFENVTFLHHPLVSGSDGEKLSKSQSKEGQRLFDVFSGSSSRLLSQVGLDLGFGDAKIQRFEDFLGMDFSDFSLQKL